MAKQPVKDPGAETAPNAYTRRELEALAKSTGMDVGTLWTMQRRQVQQLAQKSAEAASARAAEEAKAQAEAGRAKADAERPLTERMPWVGNATSAGSALLPMLLPFLTRRYGADQKLIRQWDKATAEAERMQAAARSGTGSLADATAATERAGAFANQYKELADSKSKVGGLLKDAGTIGGTTLSATELPVLPALIDRMMYDPGTRARDEADKKLTAQEFVNRLQAAGPVTAGLSATGLKIGTLANRNPQSTQARTQAMMPQSRPGWSEGPETMGKNYAGATSAELPLIDARRDVGIARQAAERELQLAQTMPPKPRGLLSPEPSPNPTPGPVAPQSPPPAAPVQNPSPPAPVAQPTLPEPVAQRQLMPPASGATGELPPAGPWADNWSNPARQAVEQHIQSGGTLHPRTGMTGDKLSEMIGQITGGSRPSPSEARARLSMLRPEVGNAPAVDEVRKVWVRDKEGRLFAIPAALATGATGVGLLASGDPAEAGYYPDRGPRRGLLQLD